MYQLIVKVCLCHNKLEEECTFIRTLKELNAHKFAAYMTEEKEMPEDG